jgi:hypothetical protein
MKNLPVPRLKFLRFTALWFASAALAFAAPGFEKTNLPLERTAPWASSWALSDFNGDHLIDSVSLPSANRNGTHLGREIEVRFGGIAERSYLNYRGDSRNIKVSVRDLDGDRDRDIIVQEAISRKLLGVWLNDGSGNFHEALWSDYQVFANEQDLPLLHAPLFKSDFPMGLSEERRVTGTPCDTYAGEPCPLAEPITATSDPLRADGHFLHRRSRAPPSQA